MPAFPVPGNGQGPSVFDENQAGADSAFMDGRLEDSKKNLESELSVSSDTAGRLEILKQLGSLSYQMGNPAGALEYFNRAENTDKADAFAVVMRGWCALALGDFSGAKRIFERVPGLTTSADLLAESRMGEALAAERLPGAAADITGVQSAYKTDVFNASFNAFLLGSMYHKINKDKYAVVFYQQAASHDPRNYKADLRLAELLEKQKDYLSAWQRYAGLYYLDTEDSIYGRDMKRLLARLPGKKEGGLFYWTRLNMPLQKVPRSTPGSPVIDAGLFAGYSGIPSIVRNFEFICSSTFSVSSAKLGKISEGRERTRWEVKFNPETGMVDLRDNTGNLVYSADGDFLITPLVPGSSILIRNAGVDNAAGGVDPGDRELRGKLEIKPRAGGAVLVDSVPLEDYLPGLISYLRINGDSGESLKALSVAARTFVARRLENGHGGNEKITVCDSSHCIPYRGVQNEAPELPAAVDATFGEVMEGDSAALPGIFDACGGLTEEGVNDGITLAPGPYSPEYLLERIFSVPGAALMCLPENPMEWPRVKWTSFIESGEIQKRAERLGKTGRVKALIPLKRTPAGRVLALRIIGEKGSLDLNGFDEISRVLSGKTLRSPLFAVFPVPEGKRETTFVIQGVGTGNGSGFCAAGAVGLAHAGKDYREILKHYFPKAGVVKAKGYR